MKANYTQTEQHLIRNSIAEIAAIAHKLPGVVVIHDLADWSVAWVSERGLKELGASLEEITALSSEQYHARYFNPEDSSDYVPKISALMESNITDQTCAYFQQVRLAGEPDFTWHMASTMVLLRNDQGKPLLTITMAFPMDSMHHMATKAERLMEENNFLRSNYQTFAALSEREKEILQYMSRGYSAIQTADSLFISKQTVETHRKNIRKKLNAQTSYELTMYARAFDLI
ncbi:helix-turn-helix transcriptional regulator [Pedobacter deserti]|uniref:helix-turn-helix transcriptional regulator n=1 Tax=Pedobacter deserti TaxID=2817382 RepID=UPI00210BCBFB|nr:LuxR C-terminal-related transcriptional regulator [Pedobacter sp. SYSU D00382]